MVVVGFDVGKDLVYGARIDRSGKVKQHYVLDNTVAAVEPLLKTLRKKYKHLLVASEATAEYHRPLAETCLKLGIPFRLLNPITTKKYVNTTVRKRKTDKSDAEVVARVALQGEGTLVTPQTFGVTKPILRTSIKLTRLSQMLLLIQQHQEEILPQEAALTEQLTLCRQQLESSINVYRERAMELTDKELEQLLRTIPGIGKTTAPTLIAEIGDITRFKGPKALIAYAGLDPKVRQSGRTLQRNTRLTKRGSPYLRRSLYIAATIAQRNNPNMQATFDRKRAEGKRYKEATIVVARRLLSCIYAVWTTSTPYHQPKA
jgi:transposase